MADVTLTVGDADLDRVARAVVAAYGRPPLPFNAGRGALIGAVGDLLAEHVRTLTVQVEAAAAAAAPESVAAQPAPPYVEAVTA